MQEKLILWLTFNPGLVLTNFRTTWPSTLFRALNTEKQPLPMSSHLDRTSLDI